MIILDALRSLISADDSKVHSYELKKKNQQTSKKKIKFAALKKTIKLIFSLEC